MQYMGGKSRIARKIAGVINEVSGRQIENSAYNSLRHCSGGGVTVIHLSACSAEAVPSKAR